MPGGGNPDYSVLATWESASDNDLSGYSGPVILDCYDSQAHDVGSVVTISGATNTSATIYRILRSASGCSVPWAGKVSTGANFTGVGAGNFQLSEAYARLQDLSVVLSGNSASVVYAVTLGTNTKAINAIAKSTNSGAGGAVGFYMNGNPCLAYNCIAYDCKTYGFYPGTLGNSGYTICCTAIGNATGFYSTTLTTDVAFNCYAANNSTADFGGTSYNTPSGWCASKDETADNANATNYKNSLDLITSGDLNADYLATAEDLYAAGGAGNNYGRNPYDDLTGTIDFDDFLKNDTAGETVARLDIRGTARPTYDTADCSWNVGASQAVSAGTTLSFSLIYSPFVPRGAITDEDDYPLADESGRYITDET